MSFTRYFDFFVDLTAGSGGPLLKGKLDLTPADLAVFVHADKFKIRIWFFERTGNAAAPIANVQLDAGSQIALAAKEAEDLESVDALFSATEFVEVLSEAYYYYEATLNLNTTELSTAIDTQKFITVKVDIEVQNADNTQRITVPQFEAKVLHQVYTGSEGVPTEGDPPYPVPGAIVTKIRGTVAIDNGVDLVTVTDLGLTAVPAQVLVCIRKPASGGNVFATVRDASISADGFTADLSAATDAVGYKLDYLLIMP